MPELTLESLAKRVEALEKRLAEQSTLAVAVGDADAPVVLSTDEPVVVDACHQTTRG